MRGKTLLVKLVAGICTVFFGLALLFAVFPGPERLGAADTSSLATLTGAAAYFAAMALLMHFLPRSDKGLRAVFWGTVLLMAAGLTVICALFSVPFSTDLDCCHMAAYDLARTGRMGLEDYMVKYAHQQPLTLMLGGLYALCMRAGLTDMTAVGEAFHVACVLVCALCTGTLMNRFVSRRVGTLTVCLFATSPVLYLYAPRFYNDFPACALIMLAAVCVSAGLDRGGLRKGLWLFAAGLLAAVGIKLRVVASFLLIAYLMATIYAWGFRRAAVQAVPLLAGLAVGLGVFAALLARFGVADSAAEFPFTHWLMMGARLETYGMYNLKDYTATLSISGKAAKMQAHWATIAERYASMFGADLVGHLIKKLTIVWSDGSFYLKQYLRRAENFGGLWELLYGARSAMTAQLCQMVHAAVLGGVVMRAVFFYRHPQKADKGFVFLLALAGAGAFYLAWEANERYALVFLPWMLALAAWGVARAEAYLAQRPDIARYGRRAALGTLGILILCTCYLARYHAHTPTAFVQQAAMQPVGYDRFTVTQEPLEQTFVADSAFDRLTLRFDKASSGGAYAVSLTPEGEEAPAYARTFAGEEAREAETILKMDASMPAGRYTLRLACISPQEGGQALEVFASVYGMLYSRGACMQAGKEIGDICFETSLDRYESLYTSRHILCFFALCAGALLIVAAAFYRVEAAEKKKHGKGDGKEAQNTQMRY